jgi:peptidoglycan/xylan/chitin deacetylase (PgdA/CDA1 family)
MINIERDFGVRSTIFIVVKPFICGLVNPFIQRFYKSRAVFYHFTDYIPLFRDLISEGWELGVHGIDAWASVENARQELEIFQKNFSQTRVGIRMHYLYQMPETSIWLEEAGFAYDSTVGSNYTANIPGGRITPYIPPGCHKFWEFPIIIQDQTVYAPAYSKVGYDTSRRMIDELLKYFRKYHGVMTILWHPDSFTAPNNWSGLYEYILQETSKDGAWIGSIGALLNKTK